MGLEAITRRGLAETAPLLAALFLLSALFLYWGTVLTGVPGRAYYKALLAHLATLAVMGLLATAMDVTSPVGAAVAAVTLLIATKVVFYTDFWRAFVAFLVDGILTAVVVYLAVSALHGG